MITGYYGIQGAGKTLTMVYDLVKNNHRKKKTIKTNMVIAVESEVITKKEIVEYTKTDSNIKNCYMALDEIQMIADSRNSMSKANKLISYLVLQARKRSVDLSYTTQSIHQVEKRLRDQTDYLCFCTAALLEEGQFIETERKEFTKEELERLYIKNMLYKRTSLGVRHFHTRFIRAKPIFGLYDTTQVLTLD